MKPLRVSLLLFRASSRKTSPASPSHSMGQSLRVRDPWEGAGPLAHPWRRAQGLGEPKPSIFDPIWQHCPHLSAHSNTERAATGNNPSPAPPGAPASQVLENQAPSLLQHIPPRRQPENIFYLLHNHEEKKKTQIPSPSRFPDSSLSILMLLMSSWRKIPWARGAGAAPSLFLHRGWAAPRAPRSCTSAIPRARFYGPVYALVECLNSPCPLGGH